MICRKRKRLPLLILMTSNERNWELSQLLYPTSWKCRNVKSTLLEVVAITVMMRRSKYKSFSVIHSPSDDRLKVIHLQTIVSRWFTFRRPKTSKENIYLADVAFSTYQPWRLTERTPYRRQHKFVDTFSSQYKQNQLNAFHFGPFLWLGMWYIPLKVAILFPRCFVN